jgi:hypothetical protein
MKCFHFELLRLLINGKFFSSHKLLLGGLSLITSSRTQGGGNILINNSVNNIYPMDCDPPSIISLQQPSIQMTLTPSSSGSSTSVNVINQRYLQQFIRYNAPLTNNHKQQQQQSSYAPASLPIDVINFSSSGTGNNNSSTSMVLPDHLNSSSLIINSNSGNGSFQHSGYAPFSLTSNESTSIQLTSHGGSKGSTGNSVRSGNISNSNNAAANTTGDESMVGVCVQQSPVVIH